MYHSRKCGIESVDHRPLARKQWTESGITFRQAAMSYDLPQLTLHDHVCGKVERGACPGPTRYLDNEEENELVKCLEGCAQLGRAKSVRDV